MTAYYTRMCRGLLQGVVACAVILVGGSNSQAQQGSPTVPPPRDFAEFLVARDLVVEGRLLSAEGLTRKPLGGCGVTGLGPYKALDVRIAVDRVRFGTADDSTLVISMLGPPRFATGLLVPGAQVIAWAFRDCNDGWRLWGRMCVVTSTGRVIGPFGDQQAIRLEGQSRAEPIRYSALDSALTAPQLVRHSTTAFEGAANVALLRLTRTVRRGEAGFTYECDSLGWALAGGDRVPRFIDFPRVPGCYPEIFPGDSLLVPLPVQFEGDRLVLDMCPRALKLQDQFAVGFGVPMTFLNYVLKAEPNGLRVRPYIAKD